MLRTCLILPKICYGCHTFICYFAHATAVYVCHICCLWMLDPLQFIISSCLNKTVCDVAAWCRLTFDLLHVQIQTAIADSNGRQPWDSNGRKQWHTAMVDSNRVLLHWELRIIHTFLFLSLLSGLPICSNDNVFAKLSSYGCPIYHITWNIWWLFTCLSIVPLSILSPLYVFTWHLTIHRHEYWLGNYEV